MSVKRRSNSDRSPHVLIDIGHPAHVHLFRHFIDHLERNDALFTITSRKKDVTEELLSNYGFKHTSISRQSKGLLRQFIEFVRRTISIIQLHRKKRFTLAVGTSVSIGFLTLFSRGRVTSYNFCEDDDDAIPLQASLAYPFSSWIVNPDCLRFKRWRSKRILVPSFHELAYLHEKRFSPNPRVLDKYGLKPGSYILVRLSSLEAHHDKGQSGVPEELIDYLRANSRDKQILESRELSTNYSFDPWDMQQLLGFSSFLISDSQTMSIEAAILGTPSIRVSSFKETLTAPIEIEKIAHHAYSFFPEETPAIVRKIDELLLAPPSMAARSASRNAILKRKIDLTDWMIEELPWNEEDAAS